MSVEKLTMKLGKSAKEEKSAERIKNFSCNLTQSVVISYMAFRKVHLDQKEVNTSNEGRNPSQLSADYYYLRLR